MPRTLPGRLAALALFVHAVSAGAEEAAPPPPPPPAPRLEGALGPVVDVGPDYAGATHVSASTHVGFFLRYGRITVSNTGAFVTRRADDIFRGLGADLVRSDRLRLHLSLRLDRGRKASDTGVAGGVDEIRPTLRGNFSATWHLDPAQPVDGWKVGLGLNADLLGRGGGQVMNLGVSRDHPLRPTLLWNYGAGLSWTSGEYMRAHFGVTEAQSARSGVAVYRPGWGLQDVSVSTGWRWEFDRQWVAFWNVSAGRLLGPAADSPRTEQSMFWSTRAGIARRF